VLVEMTGNIFCKVFVSGKKAGSEANACDPDSKTDRYQEILPSRFDGGFPNRFD
jgi:hypothetical protein